MENLTSLFRGKLNNSMFITMLCWLMLALIQVLLDKNVLHSRDLDFFALSVKKSKESFERFN